MKHRKTAVASTVAVALALTLTACGQDDRREAMTEARESTAQARTEAREATTEARTEASQAASQASAAIDDAAITTKVKSALLADDQVKGTQINVDTSGGTVRLTGTVDTEQDVQRAVDLAKGIEGVQRVENNLKASPNAAPGVVPGTQPPGTAPSSTPMPNSETPKK